MNDSSLSLPSPEQQQRAKWDLLLLDIELRTEQVRQIKRYEPWKLAATLTGTVVALAGALAGAILWLTHTVHPA